MEVKVCSPLSTVVNRYGIIAFICFAGAIACTTPESVEDEPGGELAVEDVVLADVDSPAGGQVKQLTLPGPQLAVLVTCDQEGVVPFTFTDTGLDWIGCQVSTPGSPTAVPSTLSEPIIETVDSPVGGTVQQVTIPGPESSVIVVCQDDFVPFLYQDQGTWVGCQAS